MAKIVSTSDIPEELMKAALGLYKKYPHNVDAKLIIRRLPGRPLAKRASGMWQATFMLEAGTGT